MDRKAAETLAKNKKVTARNNYIDMNFHFVKAALSSRIVFLKHMGTHENPVDILT